jgi:transcription antitermination factor NusG
MSMDNHKWYALHVRPNHELHVASRLKGLGLEEYLPIQQGQRNARRNKFNEGRPLFPGYIFSFLDLSAGPRLYSIPGVLRIVGQGGHAIPIEDDEIAAVRAIANSPLRVEVTSYFQPGEKIHLIAGPLKGVSGTFLRTNKGDKLVVSLPLRMRSLAVTVLPDWVVAAPPTLM